MFPVSRFKATLALALGLLSGEIRATSFELPISRFDEARAPCLSAHNRQRDLIAEYLDAEGGPVLRAGSWLGRDGRYLLPAPPDGAVAVRFRALEDISIAEDDVAIAPCPEDLPQAGIDALTRALDRRLARYLGEAVDGDGIAQQFRNALDAFQSSRHRHWQNVAHYEYGAFLQATDRLNDAGDHYQAASAGFAALDDHAGRAAAINSMGLVALRQGDLDLAEQHFGQALPLFLDVGDLHHVAGVNNNLGLLAMRRGRLAKAADHLEFALSILQGPIDLRAAQPDVDAQMPTDGAAELTWALNTLDNLAMARRRQGAVDLAERYWRTYLAMADRIDRSRGPAQARHNLGALMLRQGRLGEAMHLLGQALQEFDALDARRWSVESRVLLSVLYRRLGDDELAMTFAQQAVERSPQDLNALVRAYTNLAGLQADAGELDAALASFDTALGQLDAQRNTRQHMLVESRRAHVALDAGRVEAARAVQQRILEALSPEEGSALAARVRYRLAMTWLRDGQPDAAEPLLLDALEVFEATGEIYFELLTLEALSDIHANDPQARLDYSRQAVDRAIELRRQPLSDVRRVGLAATLQRIENAHVELLAEMDRTDEAWGVVERLRGATLPGSGGGQPSGSNGQLRRTLIDEHARSLTELHHLRLQDGKSADSDEVSALRLNVDRIETQLRRARREPVPGPPDDPSMLARRLREGQLLLSYYELPDRLLLWAITRGERRWVEITDGPAVRDEIRQLLERLRSPRQALGAIDQLAASLGERLIEPIGDLVDDADSLIIQPHGELHALPFAILIHRDRPLIDRVSLRRILTTRRSSDESRGGERERLLVLADPGWRRGKRPAAPLPEDSLMGQLMRSDMLAGLPGTAREAESLAALAGPNLQVDLRTGPKASRQFLERGGLTDYSILHFATHGLLDLNYPMLSALLLADEQTYGPAFLKAGDISALDFDADLVVLSGCETGAGRIRAGEGALSLARPFLVAGAADVMSTLWKIDDARTADFMAGFYRHLLKGGASAGEALAAAQRAMRDDPATNHPFYWAGFTLTGTARDF